MPREFQRTQRLAEQIQRVLSELLQREVKDPRLGFVTLTAVEVSRDLSLARVYFSLLEPEADLGSTRDALESAAGFLRSRLGRSLVVRNVPALKFIYDDTSERAARLDALIEATGVSGADADRSEEQ